MAQPCAAYAYASTSIGQCFKLAPFHAKSGRCSVCTSCFAEVLSTVSMQKPGGPEQGRVRLRSWRHTINIKRQCFKLAPFHAKSGRCSVCTSCFAEVLSTVSTNPNLPSSPQIRPRPFWYVGVEEKHCFLQDLRERISKFGDAAIGPF